MPFETKQFETETFVVPGLVFLEYSFSLEFPDFQFQSLNFQQFAFIPLHSSLLLIHIFAFTSCESQLIR